MLLSVQFRILILLSLITVSGVYGQNQSRIDSLKSNLQYSSGQERFKLLNDLGFEFRLSNPDSTIYYCRQAYQLGKELNLPKELSKPLSFIGLANAYKGDFKTSFDYHNQAIEVAAQQEDSVQLAFSYNNFGRLFFDQGDIPRAYDNLLKSLQLFEQLNDLTGLAYVYRSLSNLYKSQQDYSKALQASKKAYELRAQLKEQRALLSSLMELGSVYSLLHDTTNANESFERADSISILINDPISGAEIQIEWAEFTDDVEREYKHADVILNFSESESFSITCLEALYFGRPLIATDCGGPAEIIDNMESGWLVKNKNIDEMAEAMLSLATNEVLRESFSVEGRIRSREKFGLEKTSFRLRDLYNSVLFK